MTDLKKIRILLVEDDIILSESNKFILKKLGYDVVGTATNSFQAIEFVKKESPEIILMDIQIEGEVDGIETAKIIKNEFNIPVIFLSSQSEKNIIERAKEVNPFGYLLKPVTKNDLQVALEISINNYSLEKKLRDSQELLRSSLNSISDAFLTLDLDNNVNFMNPTAIKLFNFNEDLIGQNLNNFYNPVKKINSNQDETESFSNLQSFYNEIYFVQNKTNKLIYLDEIIQPILDSKKNKLGKIIILKDISYKIFMQKKIYKKINNETAISNLARSLIKPLTIENSLKKLVTELIRNIGIFSALIVKYNNIQNLLKATIEEEIYLNQSRFDYETKQELIQYFETKYNLVKEVGVYYSDKNHFTEIEKSIFLEKKINSIVIIPLILDSNLDSILFFEDSEERIFDEDDIDLFNLISNILSAFLERSRTEFLVKNHKDYLEKVVQEKTSELLASVKKAEEANKSKSDFLANMSHELRTPLNSIIGFSKLIQLGDEYVKEKEFLKFINTGGNHLLKLLNEILDISKMEAGKFTIVKKTTSVLECLLQAITIMSHEALKKNITLVQPDSDNEFLILDEKRIRQVFINLISNAIKFTNENGVVEIITRIKQKYYEIDIKDNGIGISLEHQAHIFENFYQVGNVMYSENTGTGLGLSICKHIIDAHSGIITFESFPGKGTTFTVRLNK